jgi:CheY-like chemotaxis protein
MTTTKQTILVVEDERPIRDALRKKLTLAGYAVLAAADGKEGLALAIERRPDLILLDLLMPVMDGITMLAQLRADDRGTRIPVIILTNQSADTEAINAAVAKHEPTFYLIKSDWTLDAIIEKIGQTLEQPEAPDQA